MGRGAVHGDFHNATVQDSQRQEFYDMNDILDIELNLQAFIGKLVNTVASSYICNRAVQTAHTTKTHKYFSKLESAFTKGSW